MWSKRDLVNMAFNDLALAGYVFDLTPEEMNTAVMTMDSMMALWETQGIRVGYQMASDPGDSDLDQPSGLPDWMNLAVYKNVAIMMAGSFGKAIPPSIAVAAKTAYDWVLGLIASNPPQMQFKGNLPQGAGWKMTNYMGGPFIIPPPQDLLTTGPDGLLDLNGPVPV